MENLKPKVKSQEKKAPRSHSNASGERVPVWMKTMDQAAENRKEHTPAFRSTPELMQNFSWRQSGRESYD